MSEYKTTDDYQSFAEEVKSEQRTFLSEESVNFLHWLESTIGKHDLIVAEGDLLYRARTCETKGKKIEKEGMKPYKNMGAEGRANAKNINMLYLAGEKEIAISETRASKDEHVTLATFVVKKELKLVDFAGENPSWFWYFRFDQKSDPKTYHEQDSLLNIGNAFSKPLTVDEAKIEYIPTQVIADFFKSKDYDGIAFRSQFTIKDKEAKYRNYALFDLDSAEAIGCELCYISDIFIEVKTEQDYEVYD
jgi:hypothetical protein